MRSSLTALIGVLAAACSQAPADQLRLSASGFGAGTAAIEVALGSQLDEDSFEVFLDGERITDALRLAPGAARGEIPLSAGDHLLFARARFGSGGSTLWRSQLLPLRPPPSLPPLVASAPAAGDIGVSGAVWIRLDFATGVAEAARASFELRCDDELRAQRAYALGPASVVVNPVADLPGNAICVLSWRGGAGPEQLTFTTAVAGAGPDAVVAYNRADARQTSPFPDDYWLRDGLDIGFAGFAEPDVWLIDALLSSTRGLDGFSPLAHLVVALSAPPDPASLPQTSAESLDPLASIGLFDLDPASPGYGQRVPFRTEVRLDPAPGSASHALLLYPTLPLTPRGRYGLVVSRRLRSVGGRTFAPSAFFRRARDGSPTPGDPAALGRVRELADEVLRAVETAAAPPIPREDVALAVRFSVRSLDGLQDDLLSIKEDLLSTSPPVVRIGSVESLPEGDVAAVVRGTFEAPDWRRDDGNLARDPESGRPVPTRTRPVEFVLALPTAAFEAPVPAIFYQHGNPGSAEEEVVLHAQRSLAGAGFAVIGFTDTLNREVSPPGLPDEERAQRQVDEILMRLLANGRPPDYFVETIAEQLAFLGAIEEIANIGRFDGLFGIDREAPLGYVGISEGANHGPALLPFAPEIRAAALVAGGRRFSEVLIHQAAHRFFSPLAFLGLRQLAWVDIWVTLALFQTALDDQDPHNFAPFLYRRPFEVAGSARKASVLLVEGLDDSLIPNHATESLAWALGPLPQLAGNARPVPFLDTAEGPVSGNGDASTTAAFVQFVPQGVDGVVPSLGCASPPLSERSANEGHYCAQSASESLHQRAVFFESAQGGAAPVIIDPTTE